MIPFIPLRLTVDELLSPTRWRRTRSACRSTGPDDETGGVHRASGMRLRSPGPSEGKTMPTNIEIKARVDDLEAIRVAGGPLADGPAVLLDQEDIFFAAPVGRLKLRSFGDGRGRFDLLSSERHRRPQGLALHHRPHERPRSRPPSAILTSILGVVGVVRKRRWLYLVGQTLSPPRPGGGPGRGSRRAGGRPPPRSGRGRGDRHRRGLDGTAGDRRGQLIKAAYIDLMGGGS